jgi:hypothetical protein
MQIKITMSWAQVAKPCNPSYSGGRDQEDRSSKPAWANSSKRPYLKNTHHKKRAGGVAQSVGPEFKPQYHKTQTNKQKTTIRSDFKHVRMATKKTKDNKCY